MPFTIEVTPEREGLYERLKEAVEEVEAILDDPKLHVKHRLRALNVLSSIIKTSSGLLKDVQLDEIEAELRELRRAMELQESVI